VYPRLSPDGRQIALDISDDNRDIWVWDLVRGTLTRLTTDAEVDRVPVWTADGRRIIFSSNRAGPSNLFWQPADGSADAERLTESANVQIPYSVTPDGAGIVVRDLEPDGTSISLHRLASGNERQLQPLLKNGFVNDNPALSPDGRWIAYESNASGRDEIYVRPFPDMSVGQWQVSTAGGEEALWARNGKELFYRAPDGSVMGVSVDAGETFRAGAPAKIIDSGSYFAGDDTATWRTYDVSADGSRFLLIKGEDNPRQAATAQRLVVVQNWVEELKRLVPTN
jgi:serine/threonine-protein kinase